VTIKPKTSPLHFKKRNLYHCCQTALLGAEVQLPYSEPIEKLPQNTETVIDIENNSRNNIQYTLDGVLTL
jgi:hypothetical protein